MKCLLSIITFVVVVISIDCKDESTTSGIQSDTGILKITISYASPPSQVSRVVATLSLPDSETRILRLTISDSGRRASGSLSDLPVGTWHLSVDALDSLGIVKYTGGIDVQVLSGRTSGVTLELEPASGTTCTPSPANIVSWWQGEGSANDARGANSGVLEGGTSFALGEVDQAFSFDGINDRLIVGDPDNLKITGSLTIEAWINIYSFPVSAGAIIARADDRPGLDPYALNTTSDGKVQFHIESTVAGINLRAVVPLAQWVHVAAT